MKLTPTQENFKHKLHKYLHATFGIMTEEGIELWSLCVRAWASAAGGMRGRGPPGFSNKIQI